MRDKRMEQFLENLVEEWHETSNSPMPLPEFLRMSEQEYNTWKLSHNLPTGMAARWNRR